MDLYIHKPIKLRNLFIAKPDVSSNFVLRKPSSFLLGFPLLASEVINLPYNQIHGQKLKSVAHLVAKYFGDKSKPSDFLRLLNLFLSSESYKQQLEYKANIYHLASLLDKVAFMNMHSLIIPMSPHYYLGKSFMCLIKLSQTL